MNLNLHFHTLALDGAYLNAIGEMLEYSLDPGTVYLWTLPMFHCNGWCFPWTLSAIIGTHVCLRQVRAEPIWNALADEKVTHLCGAPIVMNLIATEAAGRDLRFEQEIEFMTAAAAPPPAVLEAMAQRNIKASRDFLIEDRKATETNRAEAEAAVLTVYDHDTELARRTATTIDQAFAEMRNVLAETREALAPPPISNEATKLAQQKGLGILSGLQSRFHPAIRETIASSCASVLNSV